MSEHQTAGRHPRLGAGPEPREPAPAPAAPAVPAAPNPAGGTGTTGTVEDGTLRVRLGALRELVGLSRTRLDERVLAEAGRVLDEAAARDRLPRAYTTVAIAGATGSGKSTLFNALAGAQLSEAGVRRPTTASPVSCTWEAGRGQSPDGLLERLGVPARARRRAHVLDPGLRGLILLDLPDYDSVDPAHREQVDRLLGLVDAVVWVVDPEKYADALLHERYLGAFAGHADVSLIVLNQADRLPPEAVDAVLDDLRRLLDERGVALGEHGEPGAWVLAGSALTGDGVGELRKLIGELVAARTAAARRLAADVDSVARRLEPVYVADGAQAPAGLTDEVREEFDDRLAAAVGAPAAGLAAERGWLRRADRACGTPLAQGLRRLGARQAERRGEPPALAAKRLRGDASPAVSAPTVEHAVRQLADEAAEGLPEPWARAVREAAWRGAETLPGALERALGDRERGRPPRPGWWSAAAAGQAVLLATQLLGLCWLLTVLIGDPVMGRWLPLLLLTVGSVGGPLLAWGCRIAARGPAHAYGRAEEWRLRRLAAELGHRQVLEPVAAELMRYREVRERFVVAASPVGGTELSTSGQ
ncbi:ATP-binding protein [Streptomyces sp. 3MP-14]|uniref:ATP-binding protein n=1 Tax=Streptomyces mimosae TaxID=2586635 RepID=A0A5N6ALW7_9ACTN|nr:MULTISPECIES: GTPase [Streptomyces]KAB8169661.1 ATP-binding protein [Streptomyces mimosae]KAB8178409.1 ATP-binding protein [Streptomyces sp. 3MP-14]